MSRSEAAVSVISQTQAARPGQGGGEIRSLNAIRGVAALMVAVYHAPDLFGVTRTFPHAYLAVDLFFVLSGFIMLHAYEQRILAGLSLRRFVQLRLARLYPLLAIATLGGFALWMLKVGQGLAPLKGQTLWALPLNLLLLPAPSGAALSHAAFPFVTLSWSVVWEVAFCPLLYAWIKWGRRGAPAMAIAAALGLAAAAVWNGGLDGGWTTPSFWMGAVRAAFAFWAGVAIRQATRGRTAGPLLNGAALIAGAGVVGYGIAVGGTLWWADYAAAVVGFPLIIASASLSRARTLENWLGDRLGEASYSIYLLHNLSLQVLIPALKRLPHLGPAAHFGFGLAWLAAISVGAWLSWRYVEAPLRRFFSRPPPERRSALAAEANLP
jgi:peptidoglycan/LPS O-acetylase OafA/YrhL